MRAWRNAKCLGFGAKRRRIVFFLVRFFCVFLFLLVFKILVLFFRMHWYEKENKYLESEQKKKKNRTRKKSDPSTLCSNA